MKTKKTAELVKLFYEIMYYQAINCSHSVIISLALISIKQFNMIKYPERKKKQIAQKCSNLIYFLLKQI